MSRALFEQNVHTQFTMHVEPGHTVTMELCGVRDGYPSDRYEQFAVTFKGPHSPVYPQRIYDFEHAATGRCSMFIVPIGQEPGATLYEAVFCWEKPRPQEGENHG